jgi:hypothetical protein
VTLTRENIIEKRSLFVACFVKLERHICKYEAILKRFLSIKLSMLTGYGPRRFHNGQSHHKVAMFHWFRACSYDPAYRYVSLTDDLASYLFSYKILHCVHMRKRAGPLAEISFEFAEIIGRRDENFSI